MSVHPVRSGTTPQVVRAPAVITVLPGPGFRASVASPTDGTRSWGRVGPSAVARYRTHPRAGLRALGPHPGLNQSWTTASAPQLRRRSLNAVAPTDHGLDVASCAVRDGLLAVRATEPSPRGLRADAATGGSPCSPPVCRGPGVPRGWLRCRPGVRSNSVASVALPWAAGRVRRGPTAASLYAAVSAAVQRRKPHRLPALRRASAAKTRGSVDLRR